MESRLDWPSLEEVRAARRKLKKTLEEFSSWAQRSLPTNLRASNLELKAQKIRESIRNIQEGVDTARRYFRKKIKKYRKKILGRCEVEDIGKFARKLEKVEKRVSRLDDEEKKLGKASKKFEEIRERLDRASDVINNLSQEKFADLLRRVMTRQFGRSEATREKKEEKSSLSEAEKLDRVADARENTEKKSDEDIETVNNNIESHTTFIRGDLEIESATSADVTKILCNESEMTRHHEVSSESRELAEVDKDDIKVSSATRSHERVVSEIEGRSVCENELDVPSALQSGTEREDIYRRINNGQLVQLVREIRRKEFHKRSNQHRKLDLPNAPRNGEEREYTMRRINVPHIRAERETKRRKFQVSRRHSKYDRLVYPFDPGGRVGLLWGEGNVRNIGDISHVICQT